jgi:hypothetical protein
MGGFSWAIEVAGLTEVTPDCGAEINKRVFRFFEGEVAIKRKSLSSKTPTLSPHEECLGEMGDTAEWCL